jgi:hypothetical protein
MQHATMSVLALGAVRRIFLIKAEHRKVVRRSRRCAAVKLGHRGGELGRGRFRDVFPPWADAVAPRRIGGQAANHAGQDAQRDASLAGASALFVGDVFVQVGADLDDSSLMDRPELNGIKVFLCRSPDSATAEIRVNGEPAVLASEAMARGGRAHGGPLLCRCRASLLTPEAAALNVSPLATPWDVGCVGMADGVGAAAGARLLLIEEHLPWPRIGGGPVKDLGRFCGTRRPGSEAG